MRIFLLMCLLTTGLFLPLQVALSQQQPLSLAKIRLPEMEQAIQQFVNEQSPYAQNHWYLLKRPIHNQNGYYLYWKEGQSIWILGEAGSSEKLYDKAFLRHILYYPGKYLIDTNDIVETLEQVDSSTYLVDKEWFHSIIVEAMMHGKPFTIERDEE